MSVDYAPTNPKGSAENTTTANLLATVTYGQRVESIHHQQRIRHELETAFGIGKVAGYQQQLPCAQPSSLQANDLPTLINEQYVVSAKADGDRAMLVLFTDYDQQPVAALVGRNYEMFKVPVVTGKQFFKGTVLDGEVVRQTGTTQGYFWLGIDLLRVAGHNTNTYTYSQRRDCLSEIVPTLALATRMLSHTIHTKYPRLIVFDNYPDAQQRHMESTDPPLIMLMSAVKPIKPAVDAQTTLKTTWPFPIDGLIFTPKHDPVVVGRHPRMFKWRAEHCLDFGVYLEMQTFPKTHSATRRFCVARLCYMDGRREREVRTALAACGFQVKDIVFPNQFVQWWRRQSDNDPANAVTYVIGEFQVELTDNYALHLTWQRHRPDKARPNDVKTVLRTLASVADSLKLKNIVKQIRASQRQQQQP